MNPVGPGQLRRTRASLNHRRRVLTAAPVTPHSRASRVTIAGIGFSATPAQNTVRFNGTLATVSVATTTQLTVTVPAGATTGTLSVTAPGGSSTSATAFTVAGTNGTPTISGFTPAIGT